MHPGQYTVLNSTNEKIADAAYAELEYHALFLDSLGVDASHKLVLHIGGVYEDKAAASARFIQRFQALPERVRRRLVIENDDRSYNISDVLASSARANIPVVFDNLHHLANPPDRSIPQEEWITACASTWGKLDGRQKIHYSQQDPCRQPGSHSSTINIDGFMQFYEKLSGSDTDIMLEVKDKNLSAIKCINCTTEDQNITRLESEWSKYIYTVLERSQAVYRAST